jgi:hypothetical protein
VFLHPRTVVALRAYQRSRDRMFPQPQADPVLVNSRGGPLDGHNIQYTFAVLIAATGIARRPDGALEAVTYVWTACGYKTRVRAYVTKG